MPHFVFTAHQISLDCVCETDFVIQRRLLRISDEIASYILFTYVYMTMARRAERNKSTWQTQSNVNPLVFDSRRNLLLSHTAALFILRWVFVVFGFELCV